MKHSRHYLVLTLIAALAVMSTTPAMAATTKKHHARSAGAKISLKDARATALAKVPGGKIVKHELERENGKLVYTFDIRVPGKTGIEEVQVDAMNGDVVSQTHESPAKERQEAKQEKSESQKDTTKTGH